ncbi:nucleoside hydrolase [Paludibaculum fermentans]|uniref:Nucleoside hydrolase n=1 Tax=Paludibaculum fermentans TaxID=1473598 RepID=A0A7S7NTP2_PALFE|nr:nucleoside hydrolase [Paludibaculum fermentans]QOY89630.1 nucleoside hydrolase [Paludibaculum fermentans]
MNEQYDCVIIDTDPGVDDMFAILSALGSKRLRVKALTTIGGNVELEQVTRNALGILAMAGRPDVPVYAGAAGPLSVPLRTASEVHGDDGLHGLALPAPLAQPGRWSAAELICRTARKCPPRSLRLACLGPLTNVALALRLDPGIVDLLGPVVVMGGGFGTYTVQGQGGALVSQGNVTQWAEFNIWADAEAAQEVVNSGLELVFIPLDTSHRTLVTEDRLVRIAGLETWGGGLAETLRAYGAWTRSRCGTAGGPLHDPNVLAYLESPELYETVQATVAVEAGAGPERGRTTLGTGSRHRVALNVDTGGFFDLVQQNLEMALV